MICFIKRDKTLVYLQFNNFTEFHSLARMKNLRRFNFYCLIEDPTSKKKYRFNDELSEQLADELVEFCIFNMRFLEIIQNTNDTDLEHRFALFEQVFSFQKKFSFVENRIYFHYFLSPQLSKICLTCYTLLQCPYHSASYYFFWGKCLTFFILFSLVGRNGI
jgi:hypothetical protein